MVELRTRIDEKKKQFENHIKFENPYVAIGTKPGKPQWEPCCNERSYRDAFGPFPCELKEFEANGSPSEPYENDYNCFPLRPSLFGNSIFIFDFFVKLQLFAISRICGRKFEINFFS